MGQSNSNPSKRWIYSCLSFINICGLRLEKSLSMRDVMRYHNCLIGCMYSVYCKNIFFVKLYGDYWSMFYKEMLFQALYFKISLLIQYVLCNYLYNLQAISELKVPSSNVFQWRNILQLSWLSTKKHNKGRKRMLLKLSNNSMGKLTLCWIQDWFIKSRFFSHRKKTKKLFGPQILGSVIFESSTPVHTHLAHILL